MCILLILLPFSAIKASFLMSVSRARETRSISANRCLPDGKLCHQRPWIWRRVVHCVPAWLRMSSITAARSGIGLRRRKRRRWGPTDVWYVAVLPHIGFWRFLLLSPVPFVPSSLLPAVLEDEGEVSSSVAASGINRKGDTPPGLITRKFSCHSPRLILGF